MLREDLSDDLNEENYDHYEVKNVDYQFIEKKYYKISKHHKKKITSILFNNESKLLTTSSLDGYIKLYDYSKKSLNKIYNLSFYPVNCITNLNIPNLIAIASSDCTLKIFNTAIGKEVIKIYAHEDEINKVYYSGNTVKII